MKWRCAWCGREYGSDSPPCETCGHETFEPVSEESRSPFESGSFVWACTDCGREHVKRSPPCSRCGNHRLERQEIDRGDFTDEISSPSYLSVGKPYLAGIALVVGLVALVRAGVVPFPGIGGPPTPPDAPGDGDRSAGLDLGTIETALHDRFEAERDSAGAAAREFGTDGTDAYIEYLTRHRVSERYDPDYSGSMPDADEFDLRCGTQPTLGVATPSISLADYDDEAVAADAIADALLRESEFTDAVLGEARSEGIALHVGPDGTVFIGYLAC